MKGTWFLPATTAIGAGLYSVALYGGLVLFGGFLLYDTQKIIYRAETHPVYAMQPYDPVNKYVMFTVYRFLCASKIGRGSVVMALDLNLHPPRAGSGVEIIDPLRFLARMSYKATKPGSVCPVS